MKAGFSLALVALIAISALSILSVGEQVRNAAAARSTLEMIRALHELLSATTDAETGQRGYLLTGDESYLEPYLAALRDTSAQVARLRTLTRGDLARSAKVEGLAQLVAERLRHAQETVEVHRRQGFEAARDRVLTGEGKRLQNEIRLQIRAMERLESHLLLQRERRAEDSGWLTTLLIVIGGVLAFLAAAVGLSIIAQDFAASRLAETALREAGEQLEARVRERTDELEQARSSAEKQRRFLSDLIENSGSLVVVKNPEGVYQLVNRRWEEITGQKRDHVLGKTDLELFPGEDGERFRRNDLEVMAGGSSQALEEVMGEGAEMRWFLSVKFPVRDELGVVTGLCGMITEVTEHRRLERALRHSELMLREAGELSHVGGWQFDPRTQIRDWTEETVRIHDMVVDAKLNTLDALSFYRGDSRSRLEKALREATSIGTPYDLELEMVSAAGRRKWVRTIAHPILEEGRVVLVRGSLQDITERKSASILSEGQKSVLEKIASGEGLLPTLEELLRVVERAVPELLTSILLVDEATGRLRHGASLRLPEAYNRAIDGIAIGPAVGSCGTAAFRGEPVFVADIKTDPLWADFRDLAEMHGLQTCWSTPIFDAGRQVVGTFAIYRSEPSSSPDAGHLEIIEMATHTAAICIARDRAERALRESEARFRQLAESLPQIFWTCTQQGLCDYLSPQWVHFTGLSARGQLGFGWLDRVHWEDRERVDAAWRGAVKTGENFSCEFRLQRHDGIYRWFDTSAVPLRDSTGEIQKWFGSNLDISDRKEAESGREQLVRLVEHSKDFIAMARLDGKLTYLNSGGRRMIGFPEDGDPGDLHFTDYVPPSWHEFLLETVIRTAREKGQWEGEMKLVHLETGARIDVHRSTFLIRDPRTAEPLCLATVTRDITERKRADRRRATQNALSRVLAFAGSLAEATPRLLEELADSEGWDFGAIWEVDETSEVLRCTEIWNRSGVAAHELAAQSRGMVFERGSGFLGSVWDAAEVRWVADVTLEPTYRRSTTATKGKLRGAVAFPILRGRTVTGVVEFLAREIREPDPDLRDMFSAIGRQLGLFVQRRRAEEEVRRLNAELEDRVAERTAQLVAANAELESFSYSVSHDLRSPLRAVDGYSLALLEDYSGCLPEEGERYLRTIRSETQRMGDLIDDLLAFSRLSRVPLSKCSIETEALVRSVLEDLTVELRGQRVEIVVRSLPGCQGDPALLRQVWLNLLTNAIKYSAKSASPRIEISGRLAQSGPVYSVCDNGAGFDMRYSHKLFGVFQRLHRADEYEGTGVGLAIVRRIVERHGGNVWAEGEVDRGATFSFSLAAVPPLAAGG